jgi:predicted nuclease of predicted toxin-antitoxin system
MTVWVDAHLSPALCPWLADAFGVDAAHVFDLKLREAEDETIFEAARRAEAVIITKDEDFTRLVKLHGTPPSIIWLTCGNTSNRHVRSLLSIRLPIAIEMLEAGKPLVEISG